MSKIYIATRDVSFIFGAIDTGYDHLYLVYDPDDDPSNGNELVIRAGPDGAFPDDVLSNPWTLGNIIVDNGGALSASADALGGDDPVLDRYYTGLDLMGQETENVWAYMQAHAQAIHTAKINYSLTYDLADYEITTGTNSNSVVASIVTNTFGTATMIGLLPNDPTATYAGIEDTLATIVPPTDGYDWDDGSGTQRYQLGTGGNDNFSGADHANQNYVFDGGDGIDTLNYTNVSSVVTVNWNSSNDGTDDLGNELWNIEQIIAPNGVIHNGSSGDDNLSGGTGDDQLFGGGGSDILMGGDGNDILEFDLTSHAYNSSADGGAGIDYYLMQGAPVSGSVDMRVTTGGNVLTTSGSVTGVEGIKFNTLYGSGYDLYIEDMGWTYDFDDFSDIFFNYASIAESLTFNINATQWTVVGNTSGLTDTMIDVTSHASQEAPFIASNNGDTFNVSYNKTHITTGAGDDVIYFNVAQNSIRGGKVSYRGGDDIVYGSYYARNVFFQAMNIKSSDIAIVDSAAVYSHTSGSRKYYDFETDINITGHGTLTLADRQYYQDAGSDGLFDTGDDFIVSTTAMPDLWVVDGKYDNGVFTSNGYSGEGIVITQFDDITIGNHSNNILHANLGNDTVYGNGGIDKIYGEAGNDTLDGGSGNDEIYGGFDDDILIGGLGGDDLYGGHGVDTASYVSANYAVTVDLANGTASGGAGNDTLSGIENVIGSDYDDTLIGDANLNTLTGNDGNDTLVGGAGNDTLNGGAGIDTVDYSSDEAGVFATLNGAKADQNYDGSFEDLLSGIENLIGSVYDDRLIGNNGANTLNGGSGEDVLEGLSGNDLLYGEDGDDILYGGDDDDTLYGAAGGDTLRGDAGADTLYGEDGNDTLSGGDSADILYGGLGKDSLTGNAGADTFTFEAGFDDFDIIQDFSLAEDLLDISDILSGSYDPLTDAITDFVQITDNGSFSLMHVDSTGAGTFGSNQLVAKILNTTGITDEAALETSGTLITV